MEFLAIGLLSAVSCIILGGVLDPESHSSEVMDASFEANGGYNSWTNAPVLLGTLNEMYSMEFELLSLTERPIS